MHPKRGAQDADVSSGRSAHHVIVGGGSAGCVLASRLTEDPAVTVILIEAGRDVSADDRGENMSSGFPGKVYLDRANLWPDQTVAMGHDGANAATRRSFYEQARVLGGGSSINGLGANRGAPTDYDGWAADGAEGWGWSDVLPYFRKLEADFDFGEPLHGTDGPLPVRRVPTDLWTPFVRAVVKEAEALGYARRQDQNGPWVDGLYPMAVNVDANMARVSAVDAYLGAHVRRRPNLSILTDATVERLVFEGNAAVGVELRRGGRAERVMGGEIVLSAGALRTPWLMLRAGIGPGAQSRLAGIPVLVDLPGVGRNLGEHPSMALTAYLSPGARQRRGAHYHMPVILRFSSGLEGCPAGDMHMNIMSRAAWHGVGRRLSPLFFWVNKSHSRGEVTLDRENPSAAPVVDFRLLSDRRDLERLAAAFRLAVALLSSGEVGKCIESFHPAGMSARARKFGAPTRLNALLTALAGGMLDLSPVLRRWALPRLLASPVDAAALATDAEALEPFLRARVGGVYHPVGTCRMGRADDRMSVTDKAGKVKGIVNLRVCDASLMPSIPCANTNVPVLMIAEKIADDIKRGDRS